MAKQLNKVPIAGSAVTIEGVHLVAERSTGRRNRIGTVIASRAEPEASEDEERTEAATRLVVDETAPVA